MTLSCKVEKLVCNIFPGKHGRLTTCNDFLSPRDAIKMITKELKNLR